MLIYNSQISVKEYNRIRLAVGWKELDEEQARIGLENSAYLTVAWDDSESRGETKPVGMARVISDGGICKRTEGQPCRFPDKMRYSIESLGGNVGLTISRLMGIELEWMKEGTMPRYFVLVSGLLVK